MRTEGMDRSAEQTCQDTRVAAVLRQQDQEIEAAERKAQDAIRLLSERSLYRYRAWWAGLGRIVARPSIATKM